MKASRLLVAVVVLVSAWPGRAQAIHPDEMIPPAHLNGRLVLLPSFIVRNGDWVAVGAVGIVQVSPRPDGRHVVLTSRGELGLGGTSVAVGLGVIIAEQPRPMNEA